MSGCSGDKGTFMKKSHLKTSLTGYTKEQAVTEAYDLGHRYELEAHYCPQASLAALMDVFHIQNDMLFKSVYGFHGGGGDSGISICGALAGGIVAIGYLFGRSRQEFDLIVENRRATPLVKRLVDAFAAEFDGIRCRECQKKMFGREFDFWKEEDQREFQKLNGHEKCAVVVGTGASIAAGFLWDALHGNI
jgi:C_GCAxxG_C_C family probable redox protein